MRITFVELLWIASWSSSAIADPLSSSQYASDFTLPDLSGKMVAPEDHKDRIVLMDFWATWCLPCRKTLPELFSIDVKHRNQGVTILGLAVDDPDSSDNLHIKNF